MKWRWWPWRPHNGDAAAAREGASEQLRTAHGQTPQVDQTTRGARELVRRADVLAREVERTIRLRGTT